MIAQSNYAIDCRNYRPWLWAGLIFLLLIAGVRFSDGSMLLSIASGATVNDPVFQVASTQYIWDSPLKVMFLQALPAHIIWIAIAFGLLAILPAVGLLSNNQRLLWLTVVVVFLTPALKASLQNIGVGDGLVVLGIVAAAYSRNLVVVVAVFLVIALWHPQQSFFIGLSYIIARYCYEEQFRVKEAMAVLAALLFAAFAFIFWKNSLGFEYAGREAYMLQKFGDFMHRHWLHVFIAYLPIAAWLILMAPEPRRGRVIIFGWLIVLALVSFLTTDVTRVMTLISLPIVLIGAEKLLDSGHLNKEKTVAFAFLVVLLPPFSWSGLDYFLWTDLIRDVCKWGLYCA